MTAWVEDRTAAVIVRAATRLIDDLEIAGHDVTELRAAEVRDALGLRDPAVLMVTWLTVDQAAVNLNIDARTVRRWCASGRLSGQQSGPRGVWTVDPHSVARLLIPCPRDGQKLLPGNHIGDH